LTKYSSILLPTLKKKIPIIENAVQNNDTKVYSETAHAVQGAAKQLGLIGVAIAFVAMENYGKRLMSTKGSPKAGEREDLLKRIKYEFDRCKKFVESRSK